MRLDVGFIYHIETIQITQLIPPGYIGIMAGPYSIDVELFHQLDILHHVLFRDNTSGSRFMLMPVDTLDRYRDTVDLK